MWEIISIYWPVVPSVVFAASVIAKITPNETDDKVVFYIQKFIDYIAFTTGKTVLRKK